ENLRKICTPEELQKIEVVNLDRWVAQFLQGLDYSHRIVYGEELDQLWADAVARSGESLDFEAKFYQDEWSKVAHAHEAYTWEEYAQAPRRGRGVRLDRRSRLAVWRVFEEY